MLRNRVWQTCTSLLYSTRHRSPGPFRTVLPLYQVHTTAPHSKEDVVKKAMAAIVAIGLALTGAALAQTPAASPAELKQAEHDVPRLIEVLGLKPGMVVADVGAGFGAMMTVLAKQLGSSSRVYATDVAPPQLTALREAVTRERLEDGDPLLEGSDRLTNLPAGCCDAIYMRDVYHHVVYSADFNRSLWAALKTGGRLAVIDFSEGGLALARRRARATAGDTASHHRS